MTHSYRLKSDSSTKSNGNGSTVDQEEVAKFSRLANKWWDQRGEFAALQTLNALRIPLIRDGLTSQDLTYSKTSSTKPLEGYTVLDIGCGGGILAEVIALLKISCGMETCLMENKCSQASKQPSTFISVKI